jgi:hypothetical protein
MRWNGDLTLTSNTKAMMEIITVGPDRDPFVCFAKNAPSEQFALGMKTIVRQP